MTGPLLTLLNAPTLAAYTAAGYWGEETLYGVAARHARAAPDRFTVRDRHRRLSYAALVEAADRLAGHLAAQGLRPGQRVAVWLPSRVETAIALLACSRNGYVCCPSLHRNHTASQVTELVNQMRAAALIAQPRYGADADRHDIFGILYRAVQWQQGHRRAEANAAGPLGRGSQHDQRIGKYRKFSNKMNLAKPHRIDPTASPSSLPVHTS